MSDAGHAHAEGRQPTEEELRAYLAQLRQADPAEIVAQAFSMLASGAEVKLGRRDARLLIDCAAAIEEQARGVLDERLTEQMGTAISQLRTAQVDAEKQLSQMRAEGRAPAEEEGDLGTGEAGENADAPEGGTPPQQSATSRLWTPGR